jgi:putative intracellular protease/amidase
LDHPLKEVYPQPMVVCSGNLITGQNPQSARPLAEEIMKWLKDNKPGQEAKAKQAVKQSNR